MYCTYIKIINTGRKIWRPHKWTGKSSMEIIKKKSLPILGGKSYGRKSLWYGGSSYKILRNCGVQSVFKDTFLRLSLRLLPGNLWAVNDEHGKWFHQDISTKKKAVPRKVGVPVCWRITAGHLEQKFYRQRTAESHPLLHFR